MGQFNLCTLGEECWRGCSHSVASPGRRRAAVGASAACIPDKWVFIFRPKVAAPVPTGASLALRGFLPSFLLPYGRGLGHRSPPPRGRSPPGPRGPAAVQKTTKVSYTGAIHSRDPRGIYKEPSTGGPAAGDPTITTPRSGPARPHPASLRRREPAVRLRPLGA